MSRPLEWTDLKVKRGDPIQPHVERLLEHLPTLIKPTTTSEHVRLMQTSRGVCVVVDPAAHSFTPRFRVALLGDSITVGKGYINAEHLPTIKGVTLDGMKGDKQVEIPKLKIIGTTKPNAELLSWICLQATADPQTGEVDPEAVEDAFTIIHTDTLTPPTSLIGWHPLALLIWSDDTTIKRIEQIAMLNVRHSYTAPQPGLSSAYHEFIAV